MDLIAFGPAFVELVFGAVPAIPGPGEEVYSDEFVVSCGGAVSVASAAKGVGAAAGLATVFGDDFAAQVVERHCTAAGVDVSPSLRMAGGATGVTVVLNAGGDSAFLSHLPGGRWSSTPEWWYDVVERYRPGWVYVHARVGALAFIEAARRRGCRVAVDTEVGTVSGSPDIVSECAAAADLFVPNKRELSLLTGTDDVREAVEQLGAPDTAVVVKAGPAGAFLVRKGTVDQVEAGLVNVPVRDTTGAGDAFAGALLGVLAAGADMPVAVEAANRAGSAAVGRLGAVGPVGAWWASEGAR